MAYNRGSNDALEKFAAVPPAAVAASTGGGLGAVPPIAGSLPGLAAATKPGAPNQAVGTTPVMGTGIPATPTVAGMGKTQTQGSVISSPAPAAPAPAATKAASLFAPTHAPKAAKIPRTVSTVGSNNTTETVKSVAPSSSPVAPVGSAAPASNPPAASSVGSAAGGPLGGIVTQTGQTPAAALAAETASHTRNQVVSASGGGK